MATLVRWKPFREFAEIENMMNRVFDHTQRPTFRNGEVQGYKLPLDIFETEESYVLNVEVPGIAPDQIIVRLDKDELVIEADNEIAEDENIKTLLRERRSGHFYRRVRLSDSIDRDTVEASYDNGVLTLTLPKVPAVQPRTIAIKATN